MDQRGAIFGATAGGPISSNLGGTVFKLIPPAPSGGLWTETVLYTFCSLSNCVDGAEPRAGLLMDQRWALYGTTQAGDAQRPQGGTVFKLTPPSVKGGPWTETVLYKFCSKTACLDGAAPQANLIMDEQGALFGTTVTGGARDQGTVFKLTPPTVTGGRWTETVLYSFCSMTNCTDGADRSRVWLNHGQTRCAFWYNREWRQHWARHGVQANPANHETQGQWTETVLYRVLLAVNLCGWFST